LLAEIYDSEKNYLTKTDSMKGRVDVEAGGLFPFTFPLSGFGELFWHLLLENFSHLFE
jgi:hypothetical protein